MTPTPPRRSQPSVGPWSGHPGLRLVPAAPEPNRTDARARRKQRILFLCTGNSARSHIAEALLEQMSHGTIDAVSAGSNPKPLHRNAIRVMRVQSIADPAQALRIASKPP